MMHFPKLFIIFTLTSCCCVHCARILGVFPYSSPSHRVLGAALLKELAARGHEVTMVSPFPLQVVPPNYTEVQLDSIVEYKKTNLSGMMETDYTSLRKAIGFFNNMRKQGEVFLADEALQKLLHSRPKFDLVIHAWLFAESALGIGHQLGVPTVGFHVMGGFPSLNYYTGIPYPYSYVPNLFLPFTDNMSFHERLFNTVFTISFEIALEFINMPYQEELLRKHFPNAAPLRKLMDNVDLHLVCSHPATESPRPYLPNVIQIGGFHLYEKETLYKDLEAYLDQSRHGVILFSLGTNVKVSNLSPDKLEAFVNAFKRLKYDVLWKTDYELTNMPKNVRTIQWLPQRAVLAHPNIKAFITHGGLVGTVEAIFNGVPMIGIPFFVDQLKNVADGVLNGYTIQLKIEEINEGSLFSAIQKIIEDPKYAENAQVRSDFYRNQEMNPMDRAVYWVEHVVKYKGAKHLRSKATALALYQYLLLDVLVFILFVVFCSLYCLYWITNTLLKFLFENVNKVKAE